MLQDSNALYSYDELNRLSYVETKDGQTQKNRYDAENLRHEMEENNRLVQFIYNGQDVVVEKEADGNIIRLIRGYDIISSDSEKARDYYHYVSDELGSVTCIVDSEGNVLNKYHYDAFGNTQDSEETVHNRFKFTGQQFDNVSGQYYLRARFYNPIIARFVKEDNVYKDGLNLYAYCKNNPLMYVDPSGHATTSAADKAPDLTPDQQAVRDIVDYVNAHGGPTPSDEAIIRDWAVEYGLDPNSLNFEYPTYKVDSNGRWHRENGQFATTAEVNNYIAREMSGSYSDFADAMSPMDKARYIQTNEQKFYGEFAERSKASGLSDVQISEAYNAMKSGDYKTMASYFDTSSPKDGGVFCSGNKDGAAAYASSIGGTIIEQTPGGRVFDNWKGLQGMYPEWATGSRLDQKPIWNALSAQYAENAAGNVTYVHIMKNGQPYYGAVWNDIEKKILIKNMLNGKVSNISEVIIDAK